jgi:hypothetical protein
MQIVHVALYEERRECFGFMYLSARGNVGNLNGIGTDGDEIRRKGLREGKWYSFGDVVSSE